MEKYIKLVEAIRDDYSSMLFRRYEKGGDKKDGLFKENSIFEISYEINELNKKNRIMRYNITEKESDKSWEIIVGPAMLLFSIRMKPYRIELLEKQTIRGIFTIKSGFFEMTSIPLAVILLGKTKGNIWLSSVTTPDDIVSLVSNPETYERKVYFTDSLDSENFMPEYYNGELQKINAVLDKSETKKLGEIAEVIVGKSVPSYELCESGIPYLRSRDIQNGELKKSDVFVPEKDAAKYAKQLLQEGDVLLSKNFGQHKVAKVGIDDLPAIASNGLFIIRAFDVPDGYLYEYLTSETGKTIFDKQLSNIEKGTTVASINLRDLVELRVPIYDEKIMNALSSVENIKIEELMSTVSYMTRMTAYAEKIMENQKGNSFISEFEKAVVKRFEEAGWNKEDLGLNGKAYSIVIGENKKWAPDIVLLDNNIKLAVVEIKTNLSLLTDEKLKTLYYVIQSGEIPFLILTTGSYYEIHSANNKIIKKMMEPPTKEYLLSLLEGKEGK